MSDKSGKDARYDDPYPHPLEPTATGREALEATFLRYKAADAARNPSSAADQKEAEAIEAALHAALPGSEIEGVGPGGELRTTRPLAVDEQARRVRHIQRDPSRVTAGASLARLRQTDAAGCTDAALDLADSIGARDNLERMLAHQLAAAHNLAMRFVGLALAHGEKASPRAQPFEALEPTVRAHAVEASRLAHAAARVMSAFQDGMLALAKYRSGGRQTVVVQHVDVRDGGQAVVAGAVNTQRQGGDPSSQSAPCSQPEERK
jgi:hypothetical protein